MDLIEPFGFVAHRAAAVHVNDPATIIDVARKLLQPRVELIDHDLDDGRSEWLLDFALLHDRPKIDAVKARQHPIVAVAKDFQIGKLFGEHIEKVAVVGDDFSEIASSRWVMVFQRVPSRGQIENRVVVAQPIGDLFDDARVGLLPWDAQRDACN
jgi:hypothetical protein